jgi:hypothetical protein
LIDFGKVQVLGAMPEKELSPLPRLKEKNDWVVFRRRHDGNRSRLFVARFYQTVALFLFITRQNQLGSRYK